MARYTATVDSHRTPDATFDYVADFANVAEWDPSIESAKRLDAGPVHEGAEYEVTMSFLGRTVSLTYEMVEFDAAQRRAVLRGRNSSSTSTDTITVGDDGAVTYDAHVELSGPVKLLDPLVHLAFQRIGAKAANGLERELSKAA